MLTTVPGSACGYGAIEDFMKFTQLLQHSTAVAAAHALVLQMEQAQARLGVVLGRPSRRSSIGQEWIPHVCALLALPAEKSVDTKPHSSTSIGMRTSPRTASMTVKWHVCEHPWPTIF